MGRQIEYYMELESYKLLVKKAFDLGFKVIEEQNNLRICCCFEEVTFSQHGMYLCLEEAGQLIVKENGYIDTLKSPLIESGFPILMKRKKKFRTLVYGFEPDFGVKVKNSFIETKY